MPNDKELLQQTFDFFCHYIKINEIGQDELQAEAEMILNAIQARLAQPEPRVTEDMWKKLSELQQKVMEIAHTAPPKKKWVGLTDADWIIGKRSADYIAGAEWAEAKLKEKNGMD